VGLRGTLLGGAVEGGEGLRSVLRLDPPPALTIVCADASGSMGGGRRIAYAKGVLARSMVRAYQRRHDFALVAFRGSLSCQVVGPTRGLALMLRRVDGLRTGGATSIAAGLDACRALARRVRARGPALVATVIVVTDGGANRSVHGAPPLTEATAAARSLRAVRDLRAVVVDSDVGSLSLGLAAPLAQALGAPLERLRAG